MEVIITALIAICGGFFMGRTVSRFLVPATNRILRVIPYLLLAITIVNASWIGDENPIILFPFFMAAFLFCYQGPRCSRLVTGTIFFCLLEPLCMMIDTANFNDRTGLKFVFLPLFGKLVVCAALWLVSRRVVARPGTISLSGKLWGLLSGLTLAPLFSTLSFTIWQARDLGYDMYKIVAYRIAYTILPFTMLSAVALLAAIVVLSRHEELEQRQKLSELQEIYYRGLQREQSGVRTLRHDLHNHIAAAQGLLERGDIAGARQYLANLSHMPAMVGGKCYCENNIANVVLSSKAALMEQHGIQATIEVSLPDHIPVSDAELCSLLGNALDNAIEAAGAAKDKRVALRARCDKGVLMLRVDNTFAKAPTRKDGRLITGKRDVASHGFGVAAMQEIARLHGGTCDVEYTQREFCLLVSIPLD